MLGVGCQLGNIGQQIMHAQYLSLKIIFVHNIDNTN